MTYARVIAAVANRMAAELAAEPATPKRLELQGQVLSHLHQMALRELKEQGEILRQIGGSPWQLVDW